MPALTFEALPLSELAAWIAVLRTRYVAQMVRFGELPPAAAEAKATADGARFFPAGALSPGHEIVVARDGGGRVVGSLWLALLAENGVRTAFIFDVVVDERCRGRGYGRGLMAWAVARSRESGARQLQLNVFGGNSIARSLYAGLGFTESAVTMSLSL